MKVYAIKDKRMNQYQQPLVFSHVAEATRFFEEMTNNQQSNLCKWPLDYQLDQIAEYNDKTGAFENMEPKEICQIIDLKKTERHDNNDPVEPIRRAN